MCTVRLHGVPLGTIRARVRRVGMCNPKSHVSGSLTPAFASPIPLRGRCRFDSSTSKQWKLWLPDFVAFESRGVTSIERPPAKNDRHQDGAPANVPWIGLTWNACEI